MPVSTDPQPPNGDDIVITGIAGCFPESENVYQFQDNLYNKVDMVTEDDRRWKLGEFIGCCCRVECHLCGFI
jgi:acyl transferase domain-containing protein